MTLLETLVTTSLLLIVAMVIANVDDARVRIEARARARVDPGRLRAALASVHIAKHLEGADRLNLVPTTGVYQMRTPLCPLGVDGVPLPSCFDSPANYRWDQYRLTDDELRFYTDTASGCGSMKPLATQISSLVFAYKDEESLSPPGGEPLWGLDNNVVEYAVTWSNAGQTHEFRGEVTIRPGAYTDVSTGLQAPELGDLSPPPAACP